MEQYELKEMLTHVADGSVSVEEAVRRLKRAPFEEIGIASLDAHRGIRQRIGKRPVKDGLRVLSESLHSKSSF